MEPPTPKSSSGSSSPLASAGLVLSTPPEVFQARELIANMQANLGSLGATFDQLQNETRQVAHLGGEFRTAQDINTLRKEIKDQDRRHKEGIEEIKLILDDLLQKQIVEHLKQQVEEEIAAQIDELIKEQVEKCLQTHIPQDLQDEVTQHKRELEEYRLALHNSESRRLNAALRSCQQDAPLNTIFRTDGTISLHYPSNLKALFSLDAKTSKALMVDYELPDPSDSRDRNLNRFMQFCGVTYQMVRTGADARRVGMERASSL